MQTLIAQTKRGLVVENEDEKANRRPDPARSRQRINPGAVQAGQMLGCTVLLWLSYRRGAGWTKEVNAKPSQSLNHYRRFAPPRPRLPPLPARACAQLRTHTSRRTKMSDKDILTPKHEPSPTTVLSRPEEGPAALSRSRARSAVSSSQPQALRSEHRGSLDVRGPPNFSSFGPGPSADQL